MDMLSIYNYINLDIYIHIYMCVDYRDRLVRIPLTRGQGSPCEGPP